MTRLRPEPLSGSADDPARAPQRKDRRDRRAVEESAARELFRRLLPAGGTVTASFRSIRASRRFFGEKSFNSLADVPVPVDIVNVFRAPDALPGIASEAVAIGATISGVSSR